MREFDVDNCLFCWISNRKTIYS